MIPLCLWTGLMHWIDLSFNILPVPHPDGFPFAWLWLYAGCVAFIGGLLASRFLKEFAAHPPYPVRDPRLIEAMGLYPSMPVDEPASTVGSSGEFVDAPPQFRGTNP